MAHYSSSSSTTLPVLEPQPSPPSDSASSGAPTPATRPRPFRFENLASSSVGARPTVTLPLIDRVQGQGVAASRNQQNGTSSYENTQLQLQLQLQLGRTLPEEVFDMIKLLTPSDVNCGQCRLLLLQDFGKHIFSMIKNAADQCSSTNCFPIDVLDVEDNRSFVLRLKHWLGSNSYVLAGTWIPDFVTRKGLKEGDKVGLAYHGSTLFFKRLN